MRVLQTSTVMKATWFGIMIDNPVKQKNPEINLQMHGQVVVTKGDRGRDNL